MISEKKSNVNYDYEAILLLTDSTETLVGGSTKIIKKVLKNNGNPNLTVKDLDIYLREQPLGTLATEYRQMVRNSHLLILFPNQPIDKVYRLNQPPWRLERQSRRKAVQY